MLIQYIWTKYILLSILSGLLLSYGMYELFFLYVLQITYSHPLANDTPPPNDTLL